MGSPAYKLTPEAAPELGAYKRAISALTVASGHVDAAERKKYIAFFAHHVRGEYGFDAVMILGSALTDFARNFTPEERLAIAQALQGVGSCPLVRALAVTHARRAVRSEFNKEVRSALNAVIAELAVD